MSTTTRAAPSAEFSAALVHAVGTTWAGIRDRHPDVPDVMITVGADAEKQPLKLGHFAAAAWQAGDQHVSELFVGGEGLARGAEALLATLLHECAHGIANTREIQDTSRQGRYHNAKFRDLATEVGIAVSKDAKIGWSPTQLAPAPSTATAPKWPPWPPWSPPTADSSAPATTRIRRSRTTA